MKKSYRLCIKCKKIYNVYDTKSWALAILAVILVAISAFFLDIRADNLYGGPQLIALLSMIGWIIILIYLLKKQRNCKLCEGKNALIKLDTSEAQQIIKDNNLSIPK